MKTLFAAAALATLVLHATPPNYAGNWTLDAAKSTGLPPFYAEIKSHKLTVTQTDKTLDVAVTVDRGNPEPDKMHFTYNLAGAETKSETPVRTPMGMIPVPTTMRAKVNDDGTVVINIDREFPMGGQSIKATTVETWKLSADGKTLTVHRVDNNPRGESIADMVFVKD
jgi:hypothetical protein